MATKKTASKTKSATKKSAQVITKPTKTTETTVKTVKAKEKETFTNAFTKPAFIAALVAEFVGTFLLATGVIAAQGQPLYLFFILTAIVIAIGAASGAFVNPMLTIGAWATRRISTVRMTAYVLAQVLGAMLAFVVLNAFISQAPEPSAQELAYGQGAAALFSAGAIPAGKEIVILLAELLGSGIFAFIVASVTSDKKKSDIAVATGVGGALTIAALVAGSGAAVISATAVLNPAVAISLQAFTIEGTDTTWAIAIYAVASIVGGIIGFGLNSIIETARGFEK